MGRHAFDTPRPEDSMPYVGSGYFNCFVAVGETILRWSTRADAALF